MAIHASVAWGLPVVWDLICSRGLTPIIFRIPCIVLLGADLIPRQKMSFVTLGTLSQPNRAAELIVSINQTSTNMV